MHKTLENAIASFLFSDRMAQRRCIVKTICSLIALIALICALFLAFGLWAIPFYAPIDRYPAQVIGVLLMYLIVAVGALAILLFHKIEQWEKKHQDKN